MACKCLEEIPEQLKDSCNRDNQFKSKVEKIEIKGIKRSFKDKKNEVRLTAPVRVFLEGRQKPVIKTNFFTFCPWCGVKYGESHDRISDG